MFRAIGRYFRAFIYLITGRIDSARQALSMNPNVMKATYDNVIQEKGNRIRQYKDAVGGMIAQEEKKKIKLKQLTEETTKLERLKSGALAKAKKTAEKHKGDAAAIKADPDYQKCLAAYNDFKGTLDEKNGHIAEIEGDLETLVKTVQDHKVQIQGLLRDLDKIKEEKHDAVADVISAREEQAIADMVSGISEDRTSQELNEMRDLRNKAKGQARMSRELSGLDSKRDESEFLEYATADAGADEFDALLGLTDEAETSGGGEQDLDTQLPE